MRLNLALAPSFLGFNFAAATADELELFCEKIIELAPLVRTDVWSNLILDDTIVATLVESGRYPYPPTLRAALKNCNLDNAYSAEDLVRVLHRILQTELQPLGSYFGIEEALFDDLIEIEPASAISDDCLEIRRANERFFCFWALARSRGVPLSQNMFCYVASEDEGVAVKTKLILVEPATFAECPEEGIAISETIPVVPLSMTFADVVDAREMWRNGENARDVYFAVAVAAYQMHRANGGSGKWAEFARARVGEYFFESLQVNAAAGNGSHSSLTFETSARVLAHIPKNEMKEFHTTLRPDCARAYRTHINKGGEALRLMIWELKDGRLELANVGPKNEEKILHGDPANSVGLI